VMLVGLVAADGNVKLPVSLMVTVDRFAILSHTL